MFNSKGSVWFGLHMYAGLAQYAQSEKDPQRVYLNEDTIRKMDSTFQGKPVFVEHVDEVAPNLDDLRNEADGWVIESFYNAADGKHWAKFIVVTERAERAIKNGYRLSNAYVPKLNKKSGEWNGVPYQDEVTDGEYEHLAIVRNPRYEESIILSPEQFKAYNEKLHFDLKKIANSKKESSFMKLKFWNRKPVENSADLENLSVTLPKSGREVSILQLVNSAEEEKTILVNGKEMSLNELAEKYKEMHDEYADFKKNMMENKEGEEEELAKKEEKVEVEGDLHNDEDKDEEKLEKEEKKKEEKVEENKKKNASHFNALKNAPAAAAAQQERFDSTGDKVSRGKSRYGSAN